MTGVCLSVISLFPISLQWKPTDQKPYYYLFILFMYDWQEMPFDINITKVKKVYLVELSRVG
jgi:hypothetical protein